MRLSLLIVSVLCASLWSGASEPPYASKQPLTEPTIFGSGIVSTADFDSHPAFTPDGKTLYFLRSGPNFNFWTILVTHFDKGKWTTPEVAPMSGQYRDADPFITSDGKRFTSSPTDRKRARPLFRSTSGSWRKPATIGDRHRISVNPSTAPATSGIRQWRRMERCTSAQIVRTEKDAQTSIALV
jgi:hypothetical protein